MMLCAHIPAGYLSDRIGRKPMLIAAWLIGAVSMWMMALSSSLWFFVAGYLIYGLTAFVSAPLQSYVTTARGKFSVGRAMTLTSAMFNLGAVFGPVTGGWIADSFGMKTTFMIASCIIMVSVVIIFFLKKQPREVHDDAPGQFDMLANPRFISFMGVVFLMMFAMYLPQPLTPNFLENEHGVSLSALGLIGTAGNIGNVFFNLVLGQFSARVGLIAGQFVVMLFALILWRADVMPLYALGYFLMGGFRAARMFIFAEVRLLVHQAQMGLAYGITETVNSVAAILAPLLAGYLYDYYSPALMYPVSIVMIGCAIVVFFFFAPREAKPAEALPPKP
jgi:DHA1 family multidrug resistance protein-like MFS transporter